MMFKLSTARLAVLSLHTQVASSTALSRRLVEVIEPKPSVACSSWTINLATPRQFARIELIASNVYAYKVDHVFHPYQEGSFTLE